MSPFAYVAVGVVVYALGYFAGFAGGRSVGIERAVAMVQAAGEQNLKILHSFLTGTLGAASERPEPTSTTRVR